jgi:hypothetical protein
MSAAPLWSAPDLAAASSDLLAIFLNRDVVGVDQDPLGIMATLRPSQASSTSGSATVPGEAWARLLAPQNGTMRVALLLFNRDDTVTQNITVSSPALGFGGGQAVRPQDLWPGISDGVWIPTADPSTLTAQVVPHGVFMAIVTPAADTA